ncbi:glutamate--tRNA ligase [Ekhidna sp.]|uniref:glutamate--tRNA ligase n=1 Tax=Ekhidna sp. TaxID=2608089 RepID=UPI003BAAF652
MENVRVRFAPSPTGGLHIGGVRTALFNYLFAKKFNGKFILRIEDTDQARFVEGAESYIKNTLEWCGISPDEGPDQGGDFGPYRQSERKGLYRQYAEKLIAEGNAYYAFDTPEELDAMRDRLKEGRVVNPQYDTITRTTMKNSLTLTAEEVKRRIDNGDPYVIRIKIPKKEEVRLNDMVRGWVMVHTEVLDDKVLMKSDGMPTYHLANIVDDHLMKITHVIRGEEWLPSAPLHVLLYRFLGWEDEMPQFAHLPLILKPDGNGKLSKRAADKAGFPIFPLDWKDPESEEISQGFKETGFLPEALVNFLSFLGWNPGTEQEIFSLAELVNEFSEKRINKAGTKFDFEKAKWFNQQYIKLTDSKAFVKEVVTGFEEQHGISCSQEKALQVIDLLKERVTFPYEFVENGMVIFKAPETYDEKVFRKKWSEEAAKALTLFSNKLKSEKNVSAESVKSLFWETLESNGYKPGQFMQTLRLALTGEGSGPDLMTIIEIIGAENASERINSSITALNNQSV